MKIKLFRILIIVLIAIIAFSTISCGPAVIPNKKGDRTSLTISLYSGGHGTEYMDDLIVKFYKNNPEYEKKYYISYEAEKLHSGLIQDQLEAGYGERQLYIMAHNDFVHFIYSDYLEDLSDVANAKVDGEDKLALKDKMERYSQWQSIYSKYGEGVYAMPYADSVMGWVYDHNMYLENNWYTFATSVNDSAKLTEQGIEFTENNKGHLIFSSSTNETNYVSGDRILTSGKDGKFGTYDDGQPKTEAEWDAMIRKISATNGSKAFISSGQIGSYANHVVSALFGQYSGVDAYNTYFSYDSNGKPEKLSNGEEEIITLQNGYKVNSMEGIYKAYEFISKYFDSRKTDNLISLHPAVSDGALNHIDTQSLFLLGYQQSATNPQSAMLLEGAWWEYEARTMFKTLSTIDADRGYGKREYRYMLLPDMEGQISEKSAISTCESGAMIVPKDKDKERLQVTKDLVAYMASDEALNIFLTKTGSIMPYKYTLTNDEYSKLTPFTKNMLELYSDTENIEVLRPQIASLVSPLSYAGGRDNTYFQPRINNIALDQPFKIVRENNLDAIKNGLTLYHTSTNWQKFIERAQSQGFYK